MHAKILLIAEDIALLVNLIIVSGREAVSKSRKNRFKD